MTNDYLKKFEKIDIDAGLSQITDIEQIMRCKIFVWTRPTVHSKWDCFRYAPFMEKNSYDNFVDIIVEFSPDMISLRNVGLILDVDESFPSHLRLKRTKWTLFESVALHKNPKLRESVHKLRCQVENLEESWGKSYFHAEFGTEFYKKFKLSLQIWRIFSIGENKICREKFFDRRGAPKLIGQVQIFFLRNPGGNLILNTNLFFILLNLN